MSNSATETNNLANKKAQLVLGSKRTQGRLILWHPLPFNRCLSTQLSQNIGYNIQAAASIVTLIKFLHALP
jgi:hypothetical protein